MFDVNELFKKTHPGIYEKLEGPEYSFFDNNEHLGDLLAIVALGGSYAYGLDVHTDEHESDIDIRGVALNRKSEFLGMQNFEQFLNKETDTTIYGVKKFINLLAACNPNIVEMVGLRKEDYLYVSPVGQMILDNYDIFLSQRAAAAFGGYANAQLRRIQTATARDRVADDVKREYISKSIDSGLRNLVSNHNLEQYGDIYVKADKELGKIVVCGSFEKLPLSEFTDMMNVCKTINADYEKSQGNRNNKKDDYHLAKHCSHLVRLYRMGIEILRDHKINTYREDREFLLNLKNGLYMQEDGTYSQEFYDMINKLEEDLQYWKEHTTLPKSPDYEKIEELLININERALEIEESKSLDLNRAR